MYSIIQFFLLQESFNKLFISVIIDEAHCISQWGLSSKSNPTSIPFRQWYGNLGEMYSLISSDVSTVVLTATASKATKKDIFKTLNLSQATFVIERSPERPNIRFGTQYLDKNLPLSAVFESVVEELRNERCNFERTIIFCQTRKQCALVYRTFVDSLSDDLYVNRKPDARQRMVEMFHAGTPDSVEKHVLDNFSQSMGHIRVLACTVAFGMGINCKGVHRIIYIGPSKNLECYVQECGRAGRDGEPSKCVLLHSGLMAAHCSDDVKNYIENDKECKRKLMYQNFPGNFIFAVTGHDCCDFCASSCTFEESDCVIKTKLNVGENAESNTAAPQPVRNVSREQRESLNVKLETYMKKLVSENTSWPIVATTILQKFTRFNINQVLNHCDKLKTLKDVHTVVEVWRKEHATAILNAVNEVFADVPISELESSDHDEDH